MKKIAYLFIVVGIVLAVYISYKPNDETKEEFKISFFSSVTEEEKEVINNYLSRKYDEEFYVIEHTTTYCIKQNIEENKYYIDNTCKSNDIINDIYKVTDKEGITFFVKKNIISDNIELIDSLKDYLSSTFHDNYIMYKVINKFTKDVEKKFIEIGNVDTINVFKGMGIELPIQKKNNQNEILYYIIYQNTNSNLGNLVNSNISIIDYINLINKENISSIIGLHVKYEDDLTNENIQKIVSTIRNNNYVNLDYGIQSNDIIFEFSNNLYLEYIDGTTIKICKSDDDLFDESYELAYDKIISFDYSHLNNNIYYEDFINLDKNEISL